jgi:HAD superfamily phosphatase (TIGR01668 family)
MLELLCPQLYLSSVYALDAARLRARGIKGIIMDLDNTIISWGDYTRDTEKHARLQAWFDDLRQAGFQLCILSNNRGKKVTDLAAGFGIEIVTSAGKPRRTAYLRAMRELGTRAETTAMIGDQVFTDILGANRLGLYSILVVPLSRREFILTRLVRLAEQRVLATLQAKGMLPFPDRLES